MRGQQPLVGEDVFAGAIADDAAAREDHGSLAELSGALVLAIGAGVLRSRIRWGREQ
ncbi:MAG: hypothetical protein H0X17_23180, partial [Deltaproteobacteria bacterium]|nr:hypothetical protein [Deltaproteobacteria bacterium]